MYSLDDSGSLDATHPNLGFTQSVLFHRDNRLVGPRIGVGGYEDGVG